MAEIKKASFTVSPDGEVVMVFQEPMPSYWEADPLKADVMVSLLRETDEKYSDLEGKVVGIEIVGFKSFDRWDIIPEIGLWQIGSEKPLRLKEVLKHIHSQGGRSGKIS
jgi:hypothetical protein